MTLTVYHNPRCRKSREAIQYLEDKGVSFDIIKYLEQSFDKNTLGEVLKKIDKKPSEILRKNEVLWKQEYASKNLSEDQILQLLVEQPKLIERPIVTTTDKGVLARPIENLMEFLNKG
ncbi:MAG: arsenate reductase (glutaredoxin) [Flavobacteriaceae bacterium]